MSDRVAKSIKNVKVGMLFYVLSLFLAFFSRRVFLDTLGAEFMGLTGTLQNILGFLNVAELGIGTSIVYFLYKPLERDDHDRISDIMSMLAYLYRMIGLTIGAAGVVVSLAFPFFSQLSSQHLPLVYFTFYSFLATSMAGYLINYRQLLVGANQRQYVVNAYFQGISIAQSLTQIVLAYYFQNLYLWVVVGLVFTVIGCIVFNRRIRREYPWLHIDLARGRRLLKEYPEVLRKTRQIFVQKIKNFILYRADQILVFLFGTLRTVAYFDNYMIIINKLTLLVNIVSDGMNAGVGNLVAEGNVANTLKVFWELTAIRFLIVGVVIFGLLLFVQPFMTFWLGSGFLLSDVIVWLLLLNLFIMLSRGVVEMYISAYGLFHDVWATWLELIVNLSVTILLAPRLGIVGILLGKIVSVVFIAVFWKPYLLFTCGIGQGVRVYWRGMLPFYTVFALFLVVAVVLKRIVAVHAASLLSFIAFGAALFLPLILLYAVALYCVAPGMRPLIARLRR